MPQSQGIRSKDLEASAAHDSGVTPTVQLACLDNTVCVAISVMSCDCSAWHEALWYAGGHLQMAHLLGSNSSIPADSCPLCHA